MAGKEIIGLSNLGNSCFLNSAIQVLFQIASLVDFFCQEQLSSLPHLHKRSDCICFLRLVHDSVIGYKKCNSVFSPAALFSAIPSINSQMLNGQQEDSAEFLTCLLTKISEEITLHLSLSYSEEQILGLCPVVQNLGGEVTTTVVCTSCGTASSQNREVCFHFTLPIENASSIHEALMGYFETCAVEARCLKCSCASNVWKTCEKMLTGPPNYLFLSLNRFYSNHSKNIKAIAIDEYLKVSDHLYHLKAVIFHHGLTSKHGHYTSCCRVGVQWFHCDDQNVYEVSNEFIQDKAILEAVYALLYEKIPTFDECNHPDEIPETSTGADYTPTSHVEGLNFKCQDENITEEGEIILLEDEVPGARLPPNVKVKNFTKDVLERWLLCRGILMRNASKAQLVQRVTEHIALGNHHIIFSGIDNGSWFKAKVCKLQESNNNGISSASIAMQELERGVVQEEASTIVTLTEEDIEEAKFPKKGFNQITVKEMKQYLHYRGEETSGRKADLWERIQHLRQLGESHILKSGVSNQFWYQKKQENILKRAGLQPIRAQFPLPSKGWNTFPHASIPQHFNQGTAFNFLVERHPNDDGNEIFHTSKPGIRAKQYVDSGYISNIEDCCDDRMYYIRCSVKASMRKLYHRTAAVISKMSGFVLYADCDCLASSLGRCSHIAALLQCLWTYNLLPQGIASTSLPQQWGRGSKEKMPGVMRETDYASRASISEKANLDPRASGDMFRIATRDFAVEFRKNLPCQPLLLWHDVLPLEKGSEEAVSSKDNVNTISSDSEVSSLHQDIFNYDSCADKNCTDNTSNILASSSPVTFPQKTGKQAIRTKCREYLKSLNLMFNDSKPPAYAEIPNSEQGTERWFENRSPFITASVAKRVKGLTTPEAKKNFLCEHMWRLKSFTNEAIQYGICSEAKAREEYVKKIKSVSPNSTVKILGLCANKQHPQLRCSPDGIVCGFHDKEVLLEIKCPLILKDHNPYDFHKVLNQDQKNRYHLKRKADGKIEFRNTHQYYYQVQMSMGVLNLKKCHFVTWSKHDCMINTVDFDDIFWEGLKSKLLSVHRRLFVPELFLKRVKNGLCPIELNY